MTELVPAKEAWARRLAKYEFVLPISTTAVHVWSSSAASLGEGDSVGAEHTAHTQRGARAE